MCIAVRPDRLRAFSWFAATQGIKRKQDSTSWRLSRDPLLQPPGHAQMMRGCYLMNDAAGDLNPVESRMWLKRTVARGVADAEHDLAAAPATRTPAA